MKRFFCSILALSMCSFYAAPIMAATQPVQAISVSTTKIPANAKPIDLAFVFDGPSDKNAVVLEKFQKTIARSLYLIIKPISLKI